jgi:hypothetical protein
MNSGTAWLLIVLIAIALFFYFRNKAILAVDAINPLNTDNVFANTSDNLVKSVSEGKHLSLGDAAFYYLHEWEYAPFKNNSETLL